MLARFIYLIACACFAFGWIMGAAAASRAIDDALELPHGNTFANADEPLTR